MINWIQTLFSENSSVSLMRVMSFLTLVCGLRVALTTGDVALVSVLLGTAFGGKVAQKVIEVKNGQN